MRTLGLAVLVALAAAGCAGPDPVRDGSIEAVEASPADIVRAVGDLKGKVALVDFWATWCPPCRARFPHFVDTHKKYRDQGLVCVSVSLDQMWPQGREYNREKVLNFLNDRHAAFANYVATGRDDDDLARHLGLGRSIPYMALFGKDGRRVWDSEKSDLDDRQIDELIERELAK